MFVINKSIIKTSNESYIYNIAFFSEKAVSSESGERYAQVKDKQSQTNMSVNLDVRGQLGMDFFTGGRLLWTMDLYFGQNALMIDLFLKNTQLFASQEENWWSCVDYFFGQMWWFNSLMMDLCLQILYL